MSEHPRYSLAGGNQYPALATTLPAQYPVIEIVDGTGTVITNIGNGAADGTWTTMILINSWVQSGDVAPAYMKDSRGVIHMRGKVTGVSTATSCFTMPVGYRSIPAVTYSAGQVGYTSSAGAVVPRNSVGTVDDILDLRNFIYNDAVY